MRKYIYFIICLLSFASCNTEIKEITEKYEDGSPKVVSYFVKKNDVKIKIREIGFYQNQQQSYKGEFKDGQRFGKWEYWYENGKTFAKTEVSSSVSGQKWELLDNEQNPFMDNSYELTVAEIYSNGSPYHARYQKKQDNIVHDIFFYPSYKVQMTGITINDKRQGNWIYWYENGKKWSDGFFKDGLSDSTRIVWYENGNKRYEGSYKNGKECGTWKFYLENATLAKEINYDTINARN